MKRLVHIALVGIIGLSPCPPLQAAEAPKRSDEALTARLERLLHKRPDDPAVHYNLGTIRYHHADYEKAAASLNKALAMSTSSLQGRASYNLGNTLYRQGHAKESTAADEAVRLYRQALDDYRLAIRQDPRDRDAQYNYELVERRLKALQDAHAKPRASQTQQARQQPSQDQPAQPQQPQGRQSQQASEQPQQQAGRSSEEQAGQQAASAAEHANEPQAQSGDSTQTGEPQHPSPAQAQGQQPEPREASQSEQGESSGRRSAEQREMSKQQALWILDTMQREERGALSTTQQGQARQAPVGQDW